jgi:U3 small nucleolar ribonucleoprotein protein LCP5
MPEPNRSAEKGKPPRRKSHMLDEFVMEELSTAPTVESSVGSTIIDSGRVVKTARDRREERERQEYEENNFVRLPKMGKKEARELKRRGGREVNGMGGEDWSGFTGDIERLTKEVDRAGKSARLLEKSRKRKGDGDNEEGGSSRVVGDSFERKKERLSKRRKT